MFWKRLSAFAVLAGLIACGCSLGSPPPVRTTPTSLPLVPIATLTALVAPVQTKTNTPPPPTNTPVPPTQRPANTAIPLPVVPNRGNYGNACVAMPLNAGDTVNVRAAAGTNQRIIALLQTWAVIITSQGDWYAIQLPRGLTTSEVGWVSSTVTKVSAGCYPPTPIPTENTICRFVVNGNPTNVTLYSTPNGPLGDTVPAQSLNVLAQQNTWFNVISSVTGQSGWLSTDMGYLLGNCSFIPQITPIPSGQACFITINFDSPVYTSPNVESAEVIKGGTTVQPIVRTSSGWYGYKPGVTTYDAQVQLNTLFWVPYGNPLGNSNTGTVGCETLPIVAS